MAYFNELWQGSTISKVIKSMFVAYDKSQIKGMITTLAKWHEASYIHGQWQGYIKRQSSVKHSVTYRLLSHRAKDLDGQIDRIHWRGKRAIFSSMPYKLVRTFMKEKEQNVGQLITFTAGSFVIGYSLVSLVNGTGLLDKGLSMILGVVVIGMLLSIKEQWKLWYADSVMYKLYRYIFY